MALAEKKVKHKRRYCRVEGCIRIVKSQGLCQRHGAKTRKCKIEGCDKQAQGNFDKMCKAHFKLTKTQLIAKPVKEVSFEPEGESVYDRILPSSIGWFPHGEDDLMPLVAHLKKGFDDLRPRGWHRNDERRARGLRPVDNPAVQLEGWERELVWMEICMLSGCPQASFRHLARAWGRDKGFHMVLAQFICERQGNVERKKRVKGESKAVTKKAKRNPVEMAPGSAEELPESEAMEFDSYDFDMIDVMGGADVCGPIDPTANFSGAPMNNSFMPGKRGKRRPIEMAQITEPVHHPHATRPAHTTPVQHGIQHPAQHAQHPRGGRIITHEDLVCEENLDPSVAV